MTVSVKNPVTGWMVRALTLQDVESLLHVQTVCYGDAFLESREVFAQRLACAYHCSLGVTTQVGGPLQAYLAAYWSNLGKVTPLDGAFTPPAAAEQVLYLHDMSVLPALAGQGVARMLVQQAFAAARQRGLRQAALVSVQNSRTYWERQGFSVCEVTDAQQLIHLETYGEGALYMTAML